MGLLDASLAHGGPHLLAMDLDPRALTAQPAGELPPALRTLAAGRARGPVRRTAAAADGQPEDWAGRLAGLSASEQHRALLNLVRGHVATVLGHGDPEAVQADAPFKDLGFDSLTAVELRNRLGSAIGRRLPTALVFDYPHPGAVAGLLRELIGPHSGTPEAPADVEPVLGELARLESTLNSVALADSEAGAVTARLESLLAQWKAARTPAHDNSTATERLHAASADQLLDFIDNELGTS
ncbi:hypothetical protein G5C65_35735 [Streptomyces sp. SB3404]|uniref:Carrier domain-containing protein n=1 Tax=Streptomyces boncukensis TaxID=2711219 RepID=A0A6G4X877_9ACTN|nr:hypothetical protein [Streptomyces boncukensis]